MPSAQKKTTPKPSCSNGVKKSGITKKKASKSFFNYDEQHMKAAIEAVQSGMPKKTAATTFNVPR